MPIIETSGNLLDSNADLLVNTVNTYGVMGKGIALAFRKKFPEMFRDYQKFCRTQEFEPGMIHFWEKDNIKIANLATKDHYRDPSQIEWIKKGVHNLRNLLLVRTDIKSVAIPALGCANGKLKWEDVNPIIKTTLKDLNRQILLYIPQ